MMGFEPRPPLRLSFGVINRTVTSTSPRLVAASGGTNHQPSSLETADSPSRAKRDQFPYPGAPEWVTMHLDGPRRAFQERR